MFSSLVHESGSLPPGTGCGGCGCRLVAERAGAQGAGGGGRGDVEYLWLPCLDNTAKQFLLKIIYDYLLGLHFRHRNLGSPFRLNIRFVGIVKIDQNQSC